MSFLGLFGRLAVLLLIAVIIVLYMLNLNHQASINTIEKENLIVDIEVSDYHEHATSIEVEMKRILASPASSWRREVVMNNRFNLEVLSKGVVGPAGVYEMPIQRASGVIEANPSKLFRFLTTPHGYSILDPYNDPDDFDKYIERFDYAPGRLEVAYAKDNTSEAVILTSINYQDNLLVSKSILHPYKPGGSLASGYPQGNGKKTRVFMTYGLHIEPYQKDPKKSLVTIVQLYTSQNLRGFHIHSIITATYWGPMFERLDASLPIDDTKLDVKVQAFEEL